MSSSIEVTLRFATGARRQRPHQLSGNGTKMIRSGSDGMIISGTTGAHPREDSLPWDGPGIRVSGIITAGSSSTKNTCGTDSRHTNGSNMVEPSRLTQPHQEAQRFADHSTCSRSGASQLPSDPRLSQDAKSELENPPYGTCGKTDQTVDSSVVNLFTKRSSSVKQADLISGLRSLDVSEVPSYTRKD